MKIKIISNGNSIEETKVINAETGEQLEGVIGLDVHIDAQSYAYEATIRIFRPLIQMEADIKRVCATTGEELN